MRCLPKNFYQRFFLALFAIFFLSACEQSENSRQGYSSYSPRISSSRRQSGGYPPASGQKNKRLSNPKPVLDSSYATQRHASVQLHCDEDYCPTNVAYIYLLKSSDPLEDNSCSGALIAPHLVLTNAHCLPKDIRKEIVSCFPHLSIHFLNGQYRRCKRVVSSSMPRSEAERQHMRRQYQALSFEESDWALIELDQKMETAPINLRHDGVQESQDYWSLAFDPLKSSPKNALFGQYNSRQCRAQYKNPFMNDFNQALFPIALFVDCNNIRGNSGGPFVNKQGEVVALLQSIVQSPAPYDSAKSITFATNLSCLDFSNPTEPWIESDDCPKRAFSYQE